MSAQALIPEAGLLPLPAPAWLLHALLLVTFLLHLIAMNALVGGLVLALGNRLRAGGAEGLAADVARRITGIAPTLVAATVTLGVAPLLFLQVLYGRFFFTSSVIMGWGWFSVVVALIGAYYGTYVFAMRGESLGAWGRPVQLVTLAVFLWIAFVYTNNTTLMLRPDRWGALYFGAPGGTSLNLADPQLFPRWLHVLGGAVAVAGLLLAWWGRILERHGEAALGTAMRRQGIGAFFWVTMVNVGLGLVFFLVLRPDVRRAFMGGELTATVLLGLGIALAILLIVVAARARRRGDGRSLVPLTVVTAAILVDMVLMRDAVRTAYLADHFDLRTLPAQTQVLNLVLFGAMLLGGVAVVVWMVRRLLGGRQR